MKKVKDYLEIFVDTKEYAIERNLRQSFQKERGVQQQNIYLRDSGTIIRNYGVK